MFQPLDMKVFEERTGIRKSQFSHLWDEAEQIISLRDIAAILTVQAMPLDYLRKLIRNVTLEGDSRHKPYIESDIQLIRMDPLSLLVGQTFIERSKYQSILENFSNVFDGFCVTRGIAKCNALIVLGRTRDGAAAVAHYIPPIVEENAHSGELRLLDGIHRNFMVKMVGTTIETIVVKNVRTSFPTELRSWSSVKVVHDKPPRDERYFNLRPELFRDLKAIGIDG